MTENEMREIAKTKESIVYTKKQTLYNVLGVGKGKLENGEWFEGVTYVGKDGVFYTRPYNMFDGFEKVE